MQLWTPNSTGGYFASPKLSKDIRKVAQPMMKFRQFTKIEKGYAKKSGDSILIDIVSNLADKGGKLDEQTKTPETKFSISQLSVSAYEYGNKVPYTGKLEDFSEISVDNQLAMALRDDMAKVLDSAAGDEFTATKLTMVPTGSVSSKTQTFDTSGTPSQTATRNFAWEDCIEIAAYLKQVQKAPTWDGENYIGVCNAYASAVIQKDPDWKDAKHYGDPGALFTGEIGKTASIRWIEETHYLPNYLGTTTYRGAAVVFGRDTVAQVIATAEELRSDPPQDMGRSKSIGWYALLGFKNIWSSTDEGQARSIYVTSL